MDDDDDAAGGDGSSSSGSEADTECGVCLEHVDEEAFIAMPCCGKRACLACATQWERHSQSYTCIYCRSTYSKDPPELRIDVAWSAHPSREPSPRGWWLSSSSSSAVAVSHLCCIFAVFVLMGGPYLVMGGADQ